MTEPLSEQELEKLMLEVWQPVGAKEFPSIEMKGYSTDPNRKWKYPPKAMPPQSCDLWLLQEGGVAIRGPWRWNAGYLGWYEFPKRDLEQEEVSRVYQQQFEKV